MRGLLAVAGLAALLITSGGAIAASDLGKQREADMKAIGGSVGLVFDMVQGKTEFDAAKAKAALEKVAATATEFPTLFPPGSENADGKASPKIWENKADFAAAAATAGGLDALKPAMGAVAANCKACHQMYRLAD
ncbi:MAG: cytochrome c [Rhizobiales bacterium]|nr:cytochrome c [Hyphomicrobiales bacterium]